MVNWTIEKHHLDGKRRIERFWVACVRFDGDVSFTHVESLTRTMKREKKLKSYSADKLLMIKEWYNLQSIHSTFTQFDHQFQAINLGSNNIFWFEIRNVINNVNKNWLTSLITYDCLYISWYLLESSCES